MARHLRQRFSMYSGRVLHVGRTLRKLKIGVPVSTSYCSGLAARRIHYVSRFVFHFSGLRSSVKTGVFQCVLRCLSRSVATLPVHSVLGHLRHCLVVPDTSR